LLGSPTAAFTESNLPPLALRKNTKPSLTLSYVLTGVAVDKMNFLWLLHQQLKRTREKENMHAVKPAGLNELKIFNPNNNYDTFLLLTVLLLVRWLQTNDWRSALPEGTKGSTELESDRLPAEGMQGVSEN
jgi:hypothetical protein